MTADPYATIRPAEDRDVAAIAAIYRHHVLHGSASFETEPPPLEEMRRRHATLLQQGYPYLVAERDGLVVGYAYASAYRPRAAYRDTVENSVYLRTDCIGRGVGSQLLAVLIGACTERGFRQMVAVVGDSGNAPSIRLHERHGFRLVGTLHAVGYKRGRWLDTVLLQRPLGPADSVAPTRP
ncbi:MAG: N-acetyltransferase family protein [Acetobacteraceae bacterium]